MSEPIIEIIFCPFWGQHNYEIKCVRVECEECGASVAISAKTLPLAKARSMRKLCYACGMVAQVRAESEGEEVAFIGMIRGGKLPGGDAS